MFSRPFLPPAMIGGLLLVSSAASIQAAPSVEQMWETLQKQQQQIDELKRENKRLSEQVEVSAEMAERSMASSPANEHHGGSGKGKTSIGGYGELHYNNVDGADNQIDFHRFVLFFGHEFTDDIRFFSELELEHALSGDGKPGEVELEQAYVEMDLNDRHSAKAGVFLMPVGILNETHEPDTFYGVERNPIEKNIIPTTWWEGGAALTGRFAQGFSYDLALTSGLNSPTTFKPRDGRQKVAKALANDGAVTGRLKWTGMPGLELAATVQRQMDLTQGAGAEAAATLFETHVVYQQGPIGLRALYAQWDVDGTAAAALGRDEQYGWYIEPSYRINKQWGVFARYNEWDNEAGNSSATEKEQTDVGVNFWPHENVVLKFDVQRQDGAANTDAYNLGVGYQF